MRPLRQPLPLLRTPERAYAGDSLFHDEEGAPGRGSAIFLHCLGPEKPWTGGCVAIPENIMKLVMQQVQPDCVVVIDTMENMNVSF